MIGVAGKSEIPQGRPAGEAPDTWGWNPSSSFGGKGGREGTLFSTNSADWTGPTPVIEGDLLYSESPDLNVNVNKKSFPRTSGIGLPKYLGTVVQPS